jgi:hypothetical protein
MARTVSQVRWEQWRQVIARQRASGLSVAEFCRRENVSRQGFHVWNRKLRQGTSPARGTAGAAPEQRSLKQRSPKQDPPTRRLPVAPRRRSRSAPSRPAAPTAAPGFLQLPVTAARPSPWIELALPDGTVVRLPPQNLAALVTVLRALRGERVELSEVAGGHA